MEVKEQNEEQGSDLSEGEIADSNESASNGDQEEEEEDGTGASPANKKQKTSNEEGGKDGALDDSIALNFGSWKSSLSKRQLKRQKRKRKEARRVSDSKKQKKQQQSSTEFTEQQATILISLKKLRQGEPPSGAKLPKIKTAQFKDIVSNLICSSQSQEDGDSPSCDVSCRVVVAWLSMVSEKYYTESPNHFPQLKKFNPYVQFKIEHPGSNRFAKLGLEAFMMKSNQQNDGKETAPSVSLPKSISSSSSLPCLPPRTSYLLSKRQLEENGFPVMESPINLLGVDCSQYLQLFPWPSVEVQDSLSDSDTETELPIFAIDCEMVQTKNGSELARISIVNEALECVYDTFVKPVSPVTDYRTKFSGITKETLEDVSTTLQDIQEKLKLLVPPRCIFSGHSLENDFHAMKLIHPYVIDTSIIFTPFSSTFFKPKLKKLSMELLSSEIQGGAEGHNSIEDATACMKLVQKKLKEGPNLIISSNQVATSLLTELQLSNYTTGIVDKIGVVRLFGRNCSHCCESNSDAETIEYAIKIIPKCDLTFLQLHDMETFVKSPEKNDTLKQLKVANDLDSHVLRLIDGCPAGSLLFVVCGSSDISKVKHYQQQDFPDLRRWKEATMTARTGQVIAVMVN